MPTVSIRQASYDYCLIKRQPYDIIDIYCKQAIMRIFRVIITLNRLSPAGPEKAAFIFQYGRKSPSLLTTNSMFTPVSMSESVPLASYRPQRPCRENSSGSSSGNTEAGHTTTTPALIFPPAQCKGGETVYCYTAERIDQRKCGQTHEPDSIYH